LCVKIKEIRTYGDLRIYDYAGLVSDAVNGESSLCIDLTSRELFATFQIKENLTRENRR